MSIPHHDHMSLRIQNLAGKRGLTMTDVGELWGYGLGHLLAMCAGQRPITEQDLLTLSRILGTTPGALLAPSTTTNDATALLDAAEACARPIEHPPEIHAQDIPRDREHAEHYEEWLGSASPEVLEEVLRRGN